MAERSFKASLFGLKTIKFPQEEGLIVTDFRSPFELAILIKAKISRRFINNPFYRLSTICTTLFVVVRVLTMMLTGVTSELTKLINHVWR